MDPASHPLPLPGLDPRPVICPSSCAAAISPVPCDLCQTHCCFVSTFSGSSSPSPSPVFWFCCSNAVVNFPLFLSVGRCSTSISAAAARVFRPLQHEHFGSCSTSISAAALHQAGPEVLQEHPTRRQNPAVCLPPAALPVVPCYASYAGVFLSLKPVFRRGAQRDGLRRWTPVHVCGTMQFSYSFAALSSDSRRTRTSTLDQNCRTLVTSQQGRKYFNVSDALQTQGGRPVRTARTSFTGLSIIFI